MGKEEKEHTKQRTGMAHADEYIEYLHRNSSGRAPFDGEQVADEVVVTLCHTFHQFVIQPVTVLLYKSISVVVYLYEYSNKGYQDLQVQEAAYKYEGCSKRNVICMKMLMVHT